MTTVNKIYSALTLFSLLLVILIVSSCSDREDSPQPVTINGNHTGANAEPADGCPAGTIWNNALGKCETEYAINLRTTVNSFKATVDYTDITKWATPDFTKATYTELTNGTVALYIPTTAKLGLFPAGVSCAPAVITNKISPASTLRTAETNVVSGTIVNYSNEMTVIFYKNTISNKTFTLIREINGRAVLNGTTLTQFTGTVYLREPLGNQVGGRAYDGKLLCRMPSSDVAGKKYKNFNACYQAQKAACEADWLCDVACSINPCFITYILICLAEQF